jgi:uncharacterized protein YndB with AHSA1/START domain
MEWIHEHHWPLSAPPAEVFRALTGRNALQAWFAEAAEVGAEVGAPYRFWGRHTLGSPAAADADQQITGWEEGLRLGYSWRVMGVSSEVEIRLEATDEGTTARLRHTVSAALGVARERELIDDWWRYAFGNLTSHLSGQGGVLLVDFADPSPEVRLSRVIDAPPARVFQALTDPAQVAQWFPGTSPSIDPRLGGEWNLGMSYTVDGRRIESPPQRILAFDRDATIHMTWPDWRGQPEVPDQEIGFQLTGEGGGTRVDFVHRGFLRAADISDYPFGWGYFLGEIARVATG